MPLVQRARLVLPVLRAPRVLLELRVLLVRRVQPAQLVPQALRVPTDPLASPLERRALARRDPAHP